MDVFARRRVLQVGAVAAAHVLLSRRLLANGLEHQLKAEVIERFTRFVAWPSSAFTDAASPFTIGVLGASPLIQVLETMSLTRYIQGRPTIVRRLKDPADASAVHLVFVADRNRNALRAVVAASQAKPVLTIAESPRACELGVLINLYNEDGFVRFEVNTNAITNTPLKISAKLLRLARIVRP